MKSSLITLSRFGTKPKPLIFFPGWTHPIHNEPALITKLTQHFCLYAVNPPGYAESPDAVSLQTFNDLSLALNDTLRQHHLERAPLVGFSMGCRLILHYLQFTQSSTPAILIGCPIRDYPIPTWARALLSQPALISQLRKSSSFKSYAVNRALRLVSGPGAEFTSQNVTLTGAFDSLIALLISHPVTKKAAVSHTFIYGQKDPYLKDGKEHDLKHLHVIKNAPHNCIRSFEIELSQLILKLSRFPSFV